MIILDLLETPNPRVYGVLLIAYVTPSAKEFLAKAQTLGPNDLKQKAKSELQASWQPRQSLATLHDVHLAMRRWPLQAVCC